jgi:hypothetical protein
MDKTRAMTLEQLRELTHVDETFLTKVRVIDPIGRMEIRLVRGTSLMSAFHHRLGKLSVIATVDRLVIVEICNLAWPNINMQKDEEIRIAPFFFGRCNPDIPFCIDVETLYKVQLMEIPGLYQACMKELAEKGLFSTLMEAPNNNIGICLRHFMDSVPDGFLSSIQINILIALFMVATDLTRQPIVILAQIVSAYGAYLTEEDYGPRSRYHNKMKTILDSTRGLNNGTIIHCVEVFCTRMEAMRRLESEFCSALSKWVLATIGSQMDIQKATQAFISTHIGNEFFNDKKDMEDYQCFVETIKKERYQQSFSPIEKKRVHNCVSAWQKKRQRLV